MGAIKARREHRPAMPLKQTPFFSSERYLGGGKEKEKEKWRSGVRV